MKHLDLISETERQDIQRIREILEAYHFAVFSAFIKNGLVHSDIHLGNAFVAKEKQEGEMLKPDDRSDRSDGSVDSKTSDVSGFVLFDVGQFDRVDRTDAKALLWTLAAINSEKTRKLLKTVALHQLVSVSSLSKQAIEEGLRNYGKSPRSSTLSETETQRILYRKLEEAFEESIQPNAEGIIPERKTVYILLLRNSEKRGVVLPKGAFSVAKMVDCVTSQMDQYELYNVSDDAITQFLLRNLTFKEIARITASYVCSFFG